MDGNALCHLGVACFGCCYISPGRWQRGDQALGIAALARPSAAEDERERRAARHIGRDQDFYAPGMSWPIRAVNPTPTIAAPASRGMSSELPKPRQRANSAVPTLSVLWTKMSPTRYALRGDLSAPTIDS